MAYWAVRILQEHTPPLCFIFLDLSFPVITLKELQRGTAWFIKVEFDEHIKASSLFF